MDGNDATAPVILLVEDDLDTRLTLEFMLTDAGYAVHVAATLPQAYDALDHLPIAAIVTDSMAEQSSQVFERMRPLQEQAFPLPVGLITAHRFHQEQPLDLTPFTFVLYKPFDMNELLANVASMLSQALDPAIDAEALTILQFFHAMNTLQFAKAMSYCAPSVRYYSPVDPSTPIVGTAEYIRHMEERLLLYPHLAFSNILIYAAPYGRVARYTLTWEDPTKGTSQATGAITVHFADGLIAQLGNRLSIFQPGLSAT